jgi:hypothetical protein
VGDLIGRMTPQFYIAPIKKILVFLVLARLVFFPITILVVLNRFPALMHDWIPILSMIFFAISNGYYSTLCMIWAPSRVSEKEQAVAGTMMVRESLSVYLLPDLFLARRNILGRFYGNSCKISHRKRFLTFKM